MYGFDRTTWQSQLEAQIMDTDECLVQRVVVVDSTPSTMDAAALCAQDEQNGALGVLVVAGSQTSGRGQHGRVWMDHDHCTLPCTFALQGSDIDPPMLAALCACAVHESIEELLQSFGITTEDRLLIKWPNDIVVRSDINGRTNDRKLAGILIEQKQGLTLIGIGINCTQNQEHWGVELMGNAVSLRMLGIELPGDELRIQLMCTVLDRLSQWLDTKDPAAIRERYQANDAMVGTHRRFMHNRVLYEGAVESIDPLTQVTVRTNAGIETLPIAQTSHARD